jgi:hypothetical protein
MLQMFNKPKFPISRPDPDPLFDANQRGCGNMAPGTTYNELMSCPTCSGSYDVSVQLDNKADLDSSPCNCRRQCGDSETDPIMDSDERNNCLTECYSKCYHQPENTPDKTDELHELLNNNKNEIEEWKSHSPDPTIINFINRVRPHGDWDYKETMPWTGAFYYEGKLITDKEWLGNYNFGYTGKLVGYTYEELLEGGDLVSLYTIGKHDSIKDRKEILSGYFH